MTADSLPPCPYCGHWGLTKDGAMGDGVWYCPSCSWIIEDSLAPTIPGTDTYLRPTLATVPWTRDLWAEVERAREERDQLRAALAEVLGYFRPYDHPDVDWHHIEWIDVETVNRWRSLLSPSGREGQAGNDEEEGR